MTRTETVARIIDRLEANWPVELDAETWLHALPHQLDARLADRAVTALIAGETFPPRPATFNGYYRAEQERAAAGRVRDARTHCDGDGWLVIGDQLRPCPTCNPALVAVFAEPHMLAEWRNGRPTHDILGVRDRKTFAAEYGRPPCQRGPEREPTVAPPPGVAARINTPTS